MKKYATKALAITTLVTLAIAGEAGAALDANEPVSTNTIVTASGTAYGGTQSASWTVRKRTNVRTVRAVTQTGTESETRLGGTSAYGSGSRGVATVRKAARGTGAVRTASWMAFANGARTGPIDLSAGTTAGVMAGLGFLWAVVQIFWLALVLFYGYCMYRMAKKLGEPYAWLGFIPYVQIYTLVKCWGKSGWWVLWITLGYVAFFIPGFVLTVAVLHGISKRYGRGAGTTALFVFFPYVMFPVLAFSDPVKNVFQMPTPVPTWASGNIPMADLATPVQVTQTVSAAVFAPEAPVHPLVETPLAASAPAAVPAIETPVATETVVSTESSVAPEAPTATVAQTTEPAQPQNPIVEEAAKIVDSGPGFKLPGA